MIAAEVEKLPEDRVIVWMYGRFRTVRYRTLICRARFLKGQKVRVVWSRFENDKGLTENRIFIATNVELEGIEVLRAYARRCLSPWLLAVATCGNKSSLLRWMHLKMAGYALLQLLTAKYFPLERSGYNNRRHDENCPFKNYSEVPYS